MKGEGQGMPGFETEDTFFSQHAHTQTHRSKRDASLLTSDLESKSASACPFGSSPGR
jgi:hypothetical protein